MDSRPRPSFLRSTPLWLFSGGVCCALLSFIALASTTSLLQPKSSVEISQVTGSQLEPEGGLQIVEGDTQWQADIDAELNELLATPAFLTTPPAPSPLEVAFEVATEIEVPGSRSGCPPAQLDVPPHGYAQRGRLVTQSTGTSLTENAVAAALEWLSAHQQSDGGWSFAHQQHNKCDGTCTHPGKLVECRTAATSLALLSFLGAGQTHKQGKYKKNVDAGLHLLTQHMGVRAVDGVNVGNLSEGGEQIHAQAVSTLVLCEAYAMSRDKDLILPAQYALNRLLRDPVEFDDGWRWMALRSGQLANLDVKSAQNSSENQFLAEALRDRNRYQGAAANRRQNLIAIGALSQIFAEQQHDDPTLKQGMELLDRWGPKTGDLDYRYFATQALRHDDGESWTKWHASLRDALISAQEKSGHAKGSWHFADDDAAEAGGRLYCTAMSTAILEVYYRHLPIYAKAAAK